MSFTRLARLALLACLLAAAAAHAQNTMQLGSVAAIDMPEGFTLAPQQVPVVFVFQGPGPTVVIQLPAEDGDVHAHFAAAERLVRNSMPDAQAAAAAAAYTANGVPVKWAIHKGTVQASGQSVPLFAALGSARLELGGVLFMAFYPPKQSEWQARLKEVFDTLRPVGAPVTGTR